MKQIKYFSKIFISLVVSIVVVFSEVSPCLISDAYDTSSINASEANNEIGIFGAKLIYGAKLKNGNYVWDAESSIAGHRFVYRISFEFSGTGYLDPGTVKITVPAHLLKNRSGDYSDNYGLGVPHKSEANEKVKFYYEEAANGDEIIITNNIELSAAESGYIDVSYETAETTFEYMDMGGSDTFTADINVNGVTKNTTAPPVYINTTAKIKSTKKYGARLYRKWDTSWGTKPSDADSYYYIVWVVATDFEDVTQPYKFTLNENFTSYPYANVVGYMFEEQTTFSTRNYIENQTSDIKRYDYVLVRFQKNYYDNKKKQTFTNKVTSVVTPMDGKDAASSLSSSDYYDYEIAYYKPPTGHFYEQEHGNDNWHSYYGYYWDVADYGLDDLRDGTVSYLNHNIHFRSWLYGYPYPWTLAKNASSSNPYAYGKRDVKFVMTNDSFYLNDNTTAKDEYGDVRRDTNSKLLDSNDFEIEYINYYIYSDDASYDPDTMTHVPFMANYTNSDYITIDIKIGNTWHNGAGVYNLGLDRATSVNHSYIQELTYEKITLQPNCTGYRITYSNHYYYTSINTYPYIKIKNSSYVMDKANNNKRIYVTNVLHSDVYNPDGGKIVQFERYARDFIIGIEKVSDINQRVVSKVNNTNNGTATVGWEVQMSETYRTNDGLQYVTQDTGTFYVLLPKGSTIDPSKVTVFDGYTQIDSHQYEASTIINYKNSNQTLLVVNVKQQGTNYRLLYSTEYTWDAIADYGDDLQSAAAFETGNNKIADGYPDNGGNVNFKTILRDLDPTTNANKFIYDDCNYVLVLDTSGFAGLTKKVMGENDSRYSTSSVVNIKGTYMYQLRFSTIKDVKNLVLLDSLENYKDESNDIESKWRGTLTGLDLSQPKSLGINPVVYYSTIEELDLDLPENRNLSNSNVWKTESAVGGKSKAKAIAVDLSRSTSGSAFTLKADQSVVVTAYMKAPGKDVTMINEQNHDYAKAYNNIYSTHTLISTTPGTPDENRVIHQDYTSVSLRVMANVNLHKYDTSDSNTNVEGVSFCLEGTSDYGTGLYKILKTDRFGKVSFKNIEKGTYLLSEYEGSDDYLPIKKPLTVLIDNKGDVYINGELKSNTEYELGDDPRIHTDIEFCKRDLVWKKLPIKGAVFCLSGKSDYDNDIVMYSESDENGVVTFKNVELGTYKMVEVETDSNHIVSDIEYKVTVDENGNFLISDTETLENGMVAVMNEPYHEFFIVKQGRILGFPVNGAVFTLTGTSNYGTAVNLEKTTPTDGVIGFDRLEAGSYVLQETFAPEGYILDSKKRVVVIENDGTVTIDGLEQDSQKRFIVPNDESGKLEITKKWYNDDPSTRPDNIVIHVSTERPIQEVYFAGNDAANAHDVESYEANGCIQNNPVGYASILTTITGANNIKSFSKWTGDSNVVEKKIENNTAKRIDDYSTSFKIYAWYDNGAVYWYSDCPNVYLTDQAHHMFSGLNEIVTVNMTGINCEKLTDCSHMFFNDHKLTNITFNNMYAANIVNMKYMFSDCDSIRQLNLSSSVINTSNVTDMSCMFRNCYNLSLLDLTGFNTSKVTDMKFMFCHCTALTTLDISNFNTSKVTNMRNMFYNCTNISQLNLSTWNTANVTDMSYMFSTAVTAGKELNRNGKDENHMNLSSLKLSRFNTAKVTNMRYMFYGCEKLTTLDVGMFNTANVTDMSYMFSATVDSNSQPMLVTTLDVSKFNTAKVTNMTHMFYGCIKPKTLAVNGFNTAKVKDMSYMFSSPKVILALGTRSYMALTSLNVSGFNTANVTDMKYMFNCCKYLTSLNVSGFQTSKVTDMNHMFDYCSSLTSLNVSGFQTSRVTDMNHMFGNCDSLRSLNVSNFDTSRVIDMSYMFVSDCKVTSLNVSNFNTANVTNMAWMFGYNNTITSLDFSKFNTSKVTSMSGMFYACYSITSFNLSTFDTSNVTEMDDMFAWCQEATTLDLSSFNTSNVTDMSNMFYKCEKLTRLDLSNFNTSNVIWFEDMFAWSSMLTTINIMSFDTSKATDFDRMFLECTRLSSLDLSSFYIKQSEISAIDMFNGCVSLRTVYVSSLWNNNNLKYSSDMFYNCIRIRGGNGTTYNSSYTDKTYARIDRSSQKGYFTYKAAPAKSANSSGSAFEELAETLDTPIAAADSMAVETMDTPAQDNSLVETPDTPALNTEKTETPSEPKSAEDEPTPNDIPENQSGEKMELDTIEPQDSPEPEQPENESKEETELDIIKPDDRFEQEQLENRIREEKEFYNIILEDSPEPLKTDTEIPEEVNVVHERVSYTTTTKTLRYASSDNSGTEVLHFRSDDGSITCEVVKEGDTWIFSFIGLSPDLVYYVWEDEVPGYLASNPYTNPLIIEAGAGAGTISNSGDGTPPPPPPPPDPPEDPKYGSLKVSKQLTAKTGSVLTDEDRSRKFVFTVTLKDADGNAITGTSVYGNTAFNNGVATFLLGAGESIEFTDIPINYQYTVEEREEGGFERAATGSIGAIQENVVKTVQFTNTKTVTVDDNVSFKLKKFVSGRFQLSNVEYQMYAAFENLRVGETYKVVYSDRTETFKANSNGSATVNVKLKHNETVQFKDLPVGCRYRITEAAGNYTASYLIEDANNGDNIVLSFNENKSENKVLSTSLETADKDEDITVTFTNRKFVKQNLVLKKLVKNASANSSALFDFRAVISELSANEVINTSIGKMTADSEGVLTVDFQLGADKQITFYDLPVTTKYKIEEVIPQNIPFGYQVSYVIEDTASNTNIVNSTNGNATPEMTVNENVEGLVTFTNEKVVHDITIAKKVDMSGYDASQVNYKDVLFSFVITLSGLSANTEYTIIHYSEKLRGGLETLTYTTDAAGSAAVNVALRHDERIVLKGLPVTDTSYQVTELAANHYIASYSIEKNGVLYKTVSNEAPETSLSTEQDTLGINDYDVSILFTNQYSFNKGYVLPDAGTENRRTMTAAFILSFFLCGISYILINIRRKESYSE